MLKLLGAVAICNFGYIGADRVNVVLIGYYFIFQCSYNVENAEFAIKKLAQTTMRSEIGKITLDTVFREREILNVNIVGKFSSYYKSFNNANEKDGHQSLGVLLNVCFMFQIPSTKHQSPGEFHVYVMK